MADSSHFPPDQDFDLSEKLQEIFTHLPDLDLDKDSVETLDHEVRSAIAKITGGLSPVELGKAYFDWCGACGC